MATDSLAAGGAPPADFAARVVAWQQQHGRHDLPWQNTRDPYAIWVSEIMLQQTQVATVIPYYQRFMARFPDIAALALAEEDAVLQHWSGLGYYSRARNLHAAARQLLERHGGGFPAEAAAIEALPGIGRSTAAAIAAFAFGARCAILDGNVKRVLARCFGVDGWPGAPAVEKTLWALAERLLPERAVEAYTQGLMDLGATVCTRGKAACERCPLQGGCVAWRDGRVNELPAPKPRKALPRKATAMLLLCCGSDILLEKRPPSGIWGGLWSLPEADAEADPQRVAEQRYGVTAGAPQALPPFCHTFSHFHLDIAPYRLQVSAREPRLQQAGAVWLDLAEARGAALPAPVRKLLHGL